MQKATYSFKYFFFPIKDRGKKFSSKKLSFSHSNINYVVGWCWRNEIGRGNLILILFKLVSSKMKWRVRQGKWRRSPSSFRDKWEFCLQIFFFFLTEGHSTSGTHLIEELLQPLPDTRDGGVGGVGGGGGVGAGVFHQRTLPTSSLPRIICQLYIWPSAARKCVSEVLGSWQDLNSHFQVELLLQTSVVSYELCWYTQQPNNTKERSIFTNLDWAEFSL